MAEETLQLSGYSVVEDSTPVDVSDTSGGVGQINLTGPEYVNARKLLNETIDLRIVSNGITRGIVKSIDGSDGDLTVGANSYLDRLLATRQATPYTGTLGNALRYYLSLCGITDDILIDASFDSRPVSFMGWNDVVWEKLKEICTVHEIEISYVSNNVVFRPLRQRVAENYRDSSESWTVDNYDLAQNIEIYYYNNIQRTDSIFYPIGGWNSDVPIYTVEANETQVIEEIPVNASLTSIQQPVVQDYVTDTYTASSVYCVVDAAGLPFPAAQWTAQGGSITAEINPDTRSFKLTIKAPADPTLRGPFSIAAASAASTRYSSLRLVGTGVFIDPTKLTIPTGVTADQTPTLVGVTIENEAVVSEAQARTLAMWPIKKFSGERNSYSVTTSGINRIGESGTYFSADLDDANALYAGMDMNAFNTLWSGKTMDDFNNFWITQNADNFENQAFGNVGGARVYYRYMWYRIRTGTTTQDGLQYSAEDDTVMDDFNVVWDGKDMDDFNAVWAGKNMNDFNDEPLRDEF